MSKAPILHELVAVRDGKAKTATNVGIEETKKVFGKVKELFEGEVKTVEAFEESRAKELNGRTEKVVTTTVPQRLDYAFGVIIEDLDVTASIDLSNCTARADVIVEGRSEPLLTNVPSTTLLMLEGRVKLWSDLIRQAPTLPSGVRWLARTEMSPPGIFEAEQKSEVNKTEQKEEVFTLHPGTDKHPPQVEKLVKNVAIGKIITQQFHGGISSSDKQKMLDRLEDLGEAFKQARIRANSSPATLVKIGKTISDFVLVG